MHSVVPQDSIDERSSTAPEVGRSGRTTASIGGGRRAGSGGGGGIGSGPSHFDTEMEANRLAFVRHLQVCRINGLDVGGRE